MRMLAWVNLLAPDGYVNRFLIWAHVLSTPLRLPRRPVVTVIWALVYGYIPYFILPLYASLDRIDRSHLEAARDLGASPFRTFLHVTLPLIKTGLLGGAVLIALPMFGDYYTPNIVSGAPTTSMIGNQIDLYFHGGPQPTIGAAITILLSLFLLILMGYYLWTIHRATKELRRYDRSHDRQRPAVEAVVQPVAARLRGWVVNPWGKPRFLVLITWAYMLWAIVPVIIAIQFSFNDSRSRTVWQGFSTQWYWSRPGDSVWNDPALRDALVHSLKLAAWDVLIAVPIGVILALGLARWRARGSGGVELPDAVPAGHARDRDGRVAAAAVHPALHVHPHGHLAQVLGHVTFSISYVVVIVRGRMFNIGREYEEAAADLGATPGVALWRVLLPLLMPAIVASAAIVFAISIDDFVISQWLSSGASPTPCRWRSTPRRGRRRRRRRTPSRRSW